MTRLHLDVCSRDGEVVIADDLGLSMDVDAAREFARRMIEAARAADPDDDWAGFFIVIRPVGERVYFEEG